MRNTWCIALRSISGKVWKITVMSLALQKGFSCASSWAGLEQAFRHSFCASLTALSTARDHEVCESALQKTSTNSGLDMKASPWAKFVILWISSSPKRPGSHAKPHAAVQKCRFFFQTNKLRPSPPPPPPSQTNIVRLKQNAGNGVYSSLFRAKASGGHSKARETRDAQFLQKFTRFALIGRGPAQPRVCKCPPLRIPLSQSPF